MLCRVASRFVSSTYEFLEPFNTEILRSALLKLIEFVVKCLEGDP